MNPVKVSNSVSLAANFSFRTHPAIHQFFKILTPHQSISSFISLQLILNPNWPHSEQLPLSGENTSLLMPVLAMCTAVPNRRLDLSVGTATFPPHQKNNKKKHNTKQHGLLQRQPLADSLRLAVAVWPIRGALMWSWSTRMYAALRSCTVLLHIAEGSPPTSSCEHKLKML